MDGSRAGGKWMEPRGCGEFMMVCTSLSSWVHSHPGGSQWLEITKGTDITEAFEAHHIGPLASKMLENFYVRPAKTPRNSAFTFHPDGFYRTLKFRVYEKLKGVRPGPSE
ncbi:cytochrome b5-related protein-like, partial [Homalodisca vitripennis]|uniref:cytochrome b5-related protein-like n=1 Tax=Homalodisca vitripennis TaxID=197043 RepID=UPI001EE9D888